MILKTEYKIVLIKCSHGLLIVFQKYRNTTTVIKGEIKVLNDQLSIILSNFSHHYRLAKGDPSVFLPIISYCFTSFSTYIAELVMESGLELTAKNDSRFVDAMYKVYILNMLMWQCYH